MAIVVAFGTAAIKQAAARAVHRNSTPTSSARTAEPDGPTSTVITLVGENLAFDKPTIRVPAGEQVTVTFENRDRGIPHDLHIDAGSAGDFATKIRQGPVTQVLRFTIGKPGTYLYVREVHRTQMKGRLIVQGCGSSAGTG